MLWLTVIVLAVVVVAQQATISILVSRAASERLAAADREAKERETFLNAALAPNPATAQNYANLKLVDNQTFDLPDPVTESEPPFEGLS
jgi:hypothetical protein